MTWTFNPRSAHRGVTLLELLIVLALLVAIAAAIGPTMLSQLDERRFESALDVSERQFMLARAHAQATGQPVEVHYHANVDRAYILARAMVMDNDEPADPLPFGWAERPLARGYTVTDQRPEQRNGPGTIGGVDDVPTESSRVRLAVFLPDGSAIASGPRWLDDGDGRVARMNINPFTGGVTFTRLTPEDLFNAEDDEELVRWVEP